MTAPKKPSRQTRTAKICSAKLKVLSDASRLQIVRSLMNGPKPVAELGTMLGIEQSLLSHHLRILKDAELVESERDGKFVVYQLAPGVGRDVGQIDLGCCTLNFDGE